MTLYGCYDISDNRTRNRLKVWCGLSLTKENYSCCGIRGIKFFSTHAMHCLHAPSVNETPGSWFTPVYKKNRHFSLPRSYALYEAAGETRGSGAM